MFRQQVIDLFVKPELFRRYLNILGSEIPSACCGMQGRSTLEALANKETEISMNWLLALSRGLTHDQYLEAKDDMKKDENLRSQLIACCESIAVHKENTKRYFA